MKGRSLLILFVLALILGTYIYYGIQKPSEKKLEVEEKQAALAHGDLKLLESIDLRMGEKKIQLKKEKENWWLLSPVHDLASSSKVDNLSAALGRFKKMKELATPNEIQSGKIDLDQFGLKTPKTTLEYKTTDQKALETIALGSNNPTTSGTYAKLGNSGLLLASMDLDYLNTQSVDDFREMRLTTVDASKYSEVTLKYLGKEIKFVRDDKDLWKIAGDSKLPLDQDYAKNLIEKIPLIRANQFQKDLPSKAGKPELSLVIGFKEGAKDGRTKEGDPRPNGTEISFWKIKKAAAKAPTTKKKQNDTTIAEEAEFFAKSDKTEVASVAKFHFENFTKIMDDFVKKTFDDFDIADAKTMNIQLAGAHEIQIVNTGSQYDVSISGQKFPGNKENIEKALKDLRGLRAVKFVEILPSSFKPKGSFTVSLQLANNKTLTWTLEFAKDSSTLWYANADKTMKYILAKDPFNLSDFGQDSLVSAATPAPTLVPGVKK